MIPTDGRTLLDSITYIYISKSGQEMAINGNSQWELWQYVLTDEKNTVGESFKARANLSTFVREHKICAITT